MGPGFKYHVVTIAAIFFALTVGLVVGSLFASPRVINRQQRAIEGLRVSLDKKLREREIENDRLRRYAGAVTPVALDGKLAGASVAIVQTGDYGDAIPALRDTLQQAGARVLSVTVLDRALSAPDEQINATLTTLHQSTAQIPANRADLLDALARALTKGDKIPDVLPNTSPITLPDGTATPDTTLPDTPTLLPALERANLLRLDGDGEYSLPAHYVIVLAGSRQDGKTRIALLDVPLLAALEKQNVTLAVCEPEASAFSDIEAFQAARAGGGLDIATVDNVDSTLGRFALIYALRGDRDDYGVKSTAKNLLPATLTRSEEGSGSP